MPKYTVQAGSVLVPKDPKNVAGDRLTLKVGDELELTTAQAKKMDPEGFYLCPSAEFGKAKKPAPKAAQKPDDDEELDDEDLDELTKPSAK